MCSPPGWPSERAKASIGNGFVKSDEREPLEIVLLVCANTRTLASAHHGSFQSVEGTTTLGENGLASPFNDSERSILTTTQRALKLQYT